jgi:hypothetical protein
MVETVIAIPGIWVNESELQKALSQCENIVYDNDQIIDLTTSSKFDIEIYEYDSCLTKSFSIAGYRSLTETDLNDIESHKHTLYLIGSGGSIESAKKISIVADKILGCGGLGIKIESSGVAHSRKDWHELTSDCNLASLYYAYTNIVHENNVYYSCGMHNLGLADAIAKVTAAINSENIIRAIESFLLYLLTEKPLIKTGDIFSEDPNSLRFIIKHKPCQLYPQNDLFHNPFGFWDLENIS